MLMEHNKEFSYTITKNETISTSLTKDFSFSFNNKLYSAGFGVSSTTTWTYSLAIEKEVHCPEGGTLW
jgi:hypothetical protein